MYKCIIIDDEKLALGLIENYVDRIDYLELAGTFQNPLDAIPLLKKQNIDLVFLDIQMPQIKGTDFAKLIPSKTKIIFTTAYSEFALDGFELSALDYLLKPISFERFLSAVGKYSTVEKKIMEQETLIIKSGYDFHKIKLDDIIYIKSDDEYVCYYTPLKKVMSLQSLKSLEETLPKNKFKRVHRSYMVNTKKVTSLIGKEIMVGDQKIPVSASYYDEVKTLFL